MRKRMHACKGMIAVLNEEWEKVTVLRGQKKTELQRLSLKRKGMVNILKDRKCRVIFFRNTKFWKGGISGKDL